ncbi:fimbria/pilus periplasmic chaperone [Paraburkholderia caribensis]|uniref:fimbria/pilus periplasmic chaperone n=1 Tax=Paraburkholderia caribensis TaxID=75105 RepID=UPI001CC78C67|nr:fimbria/pilus periplasmic chaperone [Paraburkholderia caribensis]
MLKITFLLCALTGSLTSVGRVSAPLGLEVDRSHIYLDESLREDTVVVKNTTDSHLDVVASVEVSADSSEAPVVVWPRKSPLGPGEQAVVHVLLANPAGSRESLFRLRLGWLFASDSDEPGWSHRFFLPLLVHPQGLPRSVNPWLYAHFKLKSEGDLIVENPSGYVLSLSPTIELMPEKKSFALPKSILMPGDVLVIRDVFPDVRSNAVSITPTDLSGKLLPRIEVPLFRKS